MGKVTKRDVNKYNEYVQRYITESIQNNKRYSSCRLERYDLPDYRWFVKYCPDENVKTWDDFLIWIGFYSPCMPKDKASILIKNYAKQIGRPLKYDDFRGTNPLVPGIHYINATWGSINKMKEDLGLEIIRENMIDKALSYEQFVKQMNDIFKISEKSDVKYITRDFIDSLDGFNKSCSLDRYSMQYFNVGLADYIKKNGHNPGECGTGCKYTFEDGETTKSQFEYLFSLYLRKIGLKYNYDYFRDVRYSDFINDYNGQMNCDYIIKYNENTIYIEIPGIIEYYKQWYYEDKQITSSKSKEKYRCGLKQKEYMLANAGLNYFLLFPCDLTMDNLQKILQNPTNELRKEIERFINSNISWCDVLKIGELKYKKFKSRKRNPVIYDISEEGDIDGIDSKTF